MESVNGEMVLLFFNKVLSKSVTIILILGYFSMGVFPFRRGVLDILAYRKAEGKGVMKIGEGGKGRWLTGRLRIVIEGRFCLRGPL